MASPSLRRLVYLLAPCLCLPNCNILDVVKPPPQMPAQLVVVIGDTTYPEPRPNEVRPLTVQVVGAGGGLVRGGSVQFELADSARSLGVSLLNPGGSVQDTIVAVTDAVGAAAVSVQLGRLAGQAVVRIRVPSLELIDSAAYDLHWGFATAQLWPRGPTGAPGSSRGLAYAITGSRGEWGERRERS